MKILLYLLKINLNIHYFFIKLFTKTKRQVFFLSRQSNCISLNYELLIKELRKIEPKIEIKVICKKVDEDINATIRNEKQNNNLFKKLKPSVKYYFLIHKQMYYIATSKVVIIDGYNLPVSILKHKKGTIVIQLWHALAAIKQFGYQTIGKAYGLKEDVARILKMHNNYDYIICGSEAMRQPFAEAFNTPIEKILPIGTPVIDYLLSEDNGKEEQIKKAFPQFSKKQNVLYSPTFRNDNNYDFQDLIDNFDYEKYNLVMTIHPKSNIKIEDKRITVVDSKKYSTLDILKCMDYVITDYSAIAVEALVCNKKVMFFLYDYEEYSKQNGLNIDLFEEFPLYTAKNANELLKVLKEDNYDLKELKRLREKYVPNTLGNCTKRMIDLIRKELQ